MENSIDGFAQKTITSTNLNSDFGLQSVVAREIITSFLKKLQTPSFMTEKIFTEWKVLFSHISGDEQQHIQVNDDIIDELSELYQIPQTFTLEEIIFSIHSYIAFVIKLLANELTFHISSFNKESELLKMASKDLLGIKAFQNFIEQGGYYRKAGITNFLKGLELFSWYLNDLDQEMGCVIKKIYQSLASYFFGNDHVNSFRTNDLFRELYQNLIPPKVRKFLGEVYTPNWLTEFVIRDSGWDGDPHKKVLDPSCGSGAFIVQFITHMREFSEGKIENTELITLLLNNITGFDLNPLAVLLARTNFLWNTIDLLEPKEEFTIPIYQTDVLLLDKELSQGNLVQDQKNISNFAEKFDYIIGNPPWINWEFLPENFKVKGIELWKNYQLFTANRMNAMLGEAKYDLSAVFVYVCISTYLKDQGILDFVLTASLVKGLPAKGFRKYYYEHNGDKKHFKLLHVHDLTSFQPFVNAAPKTAIMKFRKDQTTDYPVDYYVWQKTGPLSPNNTWNEIENNVQLHKNFAIPVVAEDLSSNLLVGKSGERLLELRESVFKKANYDAFEGCNTEGFNAAFWLINIKQARNGGILFVNYNKAQKKKIHLDSDFELEQDLVYPLLRSGNIAKWNYSIDTFIIFTPKYGEETIVNESIFKETYPKTYHYFTHVKTKLQERASFKNKSKGMAFYLLYGKPMMAHPFKVVWNRMATEINAVVIEEFENELIGTKAPIPQETLVFIQTSTLQEAHFVCGIVNSNIFSKLVSMYQIKGGKGFGTPDILEKIFIPRYNDSRKSHQKISDLSKRIHQKYSQKSSALPEENDLEEAVLSLYGIKDFLLEL